MEETLTLEFGEVGVGSWFTAFFGANMGAVDNTRVGYASSVSGGIVGNVLGTPPYFESSAPRVMGGGSDSGCDSCVVPFGRWLAVRAGTVTTVEAAAFASVRGYTTNSALNSSSRSRDEIY